LIPAHPDLDAPVGKKSRWWDSLQLHFTIAFYILLTDLFQGITTRRNKGDKSAANAQSGSSKPNIKKATFDTTKKKEVGVSDLTLISKVSNEAINENLKKRFENGEIYVRAKREQPMPPKY
jgi:hypothetical protein